MPISLHEDDVGHDCEIWYPNLRSCMAYTVVLDDGTLLGAHLTVATRYRQFLDITAYFRARLGTANILSVILIGNFVSWQIKDESLLRAGENLRETIRTSLGCDSCVTFQYDSVCTDNGGLGTAAHLTHRGNEFLYPHVELYKHGAWSNIVWLEIDEPTAQNPEIQHSHAPSAGEMEYGDKKQGMHRPSEVNLVTPNGEKTVIDQADMERT